MKVLIFEDEAPAARRIERLLSTVAPKAQVLAVLASVSEGLAWLQTNTQPDIILSDIELIDGRCFDIYSRVQPPCPVIFTTAYDAFALDAFDHNGIAYLLKPIEEEALRKALAKWANLRSGGQETAIQQQQAALKELLKTLAPQTARFRERFLLKYGDRFIPLAAMQIAYLYASEKAVFACTEEGKSWPLDETLDELEAQLDPASFFRLNRAVLAQRTAIAQIAAHFNGRLKIGLLPAYPDDVFISRERAAAFRAWMNH